MSVWLIKPSTDTRDGAATVRSRIGLSAEGDIITPTDDLFARFCDGHDRDDVVIGAVLYPRAGGRHAPHRRRV